MTVNASRTSRIAIAAAALALLNAACGGADTKSGNDTAAAAPTGESAAVVAANGSDAAAPAKPAVAAGPTSNLPPNELGTVMVLEYHRIGSNEGKWYRSEANFRKDLQTLYDKGYRPVTMRDVLSGNIDIPAGTTPVVFTFDDSSKGQFSYQPDGSIDPHSMVGMWSDFKAKNPGWNGGGTWCVLPGATHPSNFWGEKASKETPRAEREAAIKKKVDYLLQNGHEICNHTMWHAKLSQYPDAFVQDQIGSGLDSLRTYLPADYKVVTFALPLGLWPKNRSLAWHGTYRNGKTYDNGIVMEVSGGPNESPFDTKFDPHSVNRLIAAPHALDSQIAAYEKNPATRYVSDGDPRTVSYPQSEAARLDQSKLGGRTAKPVSGGTPAT